VISVSSLAVCLGISVAARGRSALILLAFLRFVGTSLSRFALIGSLQPFRRQTKSLESGSVR
jgi:hypothetical protein